MAKMLKYGLNRILVFSIGSEQRSNMATHKKTMKIIDDFLSFSKEYRERKPNKKEILNGEVKWLDLYKKSMEVISEYDINKINYHRGKKV